MGAKISVIIPTFNRAGIISETLDSVLAQTFTDWECLVVDDGSSDGTDKLMKKYRERDVRIKYIKRPFDRKKGGNSCRNIGLERASGEYIQFLDSDDLISPNKLKAQLKALEDSGNPTAIATCKWGFFKSKENVLQTKQYRPTYINSDNPSKIFGIYARYGTFLPHHVFMLSRSAIKNAGVWNENLITNQDGEFFTRVLLCCSTMIFVPEAEVYYRNGGESNISYLRNEEKIRNLILSWQIIDDVIYNTLRIHNHPIVEASRTTIYNKIIKDYPKLVEENQLFFKLRRSKLKHLLIKIFSRINIIYLEKIKVLL